MTWLEREADKIMAAREREAAHKLASLAKNREARMQPNGRPAFDLTADEIARSTQTAMRLAEQETDAIVQRAVTNATRDGLI